MLIAQASDLHLEFGEITLPNKQGAKVLILSGDILIAEVLHNHSITEMSSHTFGILSVNQTQAIKFRTFLRHVSEEYEYVIYVLGNHEYYGGKFPDAIKWMQDEFKNYKNIYLLEDSQMDIDGITFLGGTLWTSMNNRDPMTMQVIRNMMNDFNLIRNSEENYRKLMPVDVARKHTKTVEYIKQTVESDPSKRYVVVGHHGPTPLSINDMYKADYHTNGGYASDLSQFIIDHPQIKLWTAGHTHFAHRYYMGETLVACNPRGYIGHEACADTFTLKFIDLDNLPARFEGVDWNWTLPV